MTWRDSLREFIDWIDWGTVLAVVYGMILYDLLDVVCKAVVLGTAYVLGWW